MDTVHSGEVGAMETHITFRVCTAADVSKIELVGSPKPLGKWHLQNALHMVRGEATGDAQLSRFFRVAHFGTSDACMLWLVQLVSKSLPCYFGNPLMPRQSGLCQLSLLWTWQGMGPW